MNSGSNKLITRDEATPIVEEITARLMPHCEKVEVVGSYRRQRKQIHDVEFVILPKKEKIPIDLFGNVQEVRNLELVADIKSLQKIKGSASDGKYTQRIHPSGMKIDFFFADNLNYGWIKLIRTGPWTYSKYVASKQLPMWGYSSKNGYITRRVDYIIMPVPDEEQVYQLINQKPILPFARM